MKCRAQCLSPNLRTVEIISGAEKLGYPRPYYPPTVLGIISYVINLWRVASRLFGADVMVRGKNTTHADNLKQFSGTLGLSHLRRAT
jgi:hypothetical protein